MYDYNFSQGGGGGELSRVLYGEDQKVPLSYAFHRKLYPFHIPKERFLLNFSLEKALKILE